MNTSKMEQDFADLPEEMVQRLEKLHRQEVERRRKRAPADYFPWHHIQSWVLEAPNLCKHPVRIILAAGGNRGGKSALAKGIYSQVVTRRSPLNKQFATTDRFTGEVRTKDDTDPLTIWIAPPTLEKARQDWIAPQDRMGLKFWAGDQFVHHQKNPDNVIYTRPPGLNPEDIETEDGYRLEDCDSTLIKSQDQDVMTFESSEVDLCIFDEELRHEQKWNSVLLRVATVNGVIVMPFTPLHGLSWSYERYWKPLIKDGKATKLGDRRWIYDPEKGATVIACQMGSRDNPRARSYADEIEADPRMGDAEKEARLYGEYGYVEGALIKSLSGLDVLSPNPEHKPYIVDALPGEKHRGTRVPGRIEDWYLVADPNKSYGAVLGALDQDGNLFFVAEHLEENWPNRLHAQAFKEMERKYASGTVWRYADPGSAGAQSIIDLADVGMMFEVMPKGMGSVSRSIKTLRGMAWIDPQHEHPITGEKGAPRVYFYRPGLVKKSHDEGREVLRCMLAEQIGQARQTDNESAPPDTPHKDSRNKLDLFDCARYMAELVAVSSYSRDEEGRFSKDTKGPNNLPGAKEFFDRDKEDSEIGFSPDTEIWTPDYEW